MQLRFSITKGLTAASDANIVGELTFVDPASDTATDVMAALHREQEATVSFTVAGDTTNYKSTGPSGFQLIQSLCYLLSQGSRGKMLVALRDPQKHTTLYQFAMQRKPAAPHDIEATTA